MIGDSPTLTIAISTLGSGAKRISPLEPIDGIQYLIVIQKYEGIASCVSEREDVSIIKSDTTGLSLSRNIALDDCRTDLILLADDDLNFNADGILALRNRFRADANLHFALGRLVDPDGNLLKKYPESRRALTKREVGYVGSPELLVRMSFVRRHNLKFDERFGLGAEYPSGEEYIFLSDAMKSGANIRHFPHIVASHPIDRTGLIWDDVDIIRARSKVLRRVWGVWSPIFRARYAMAKRNTLGLENSIRFFFGMKIIRSKLRV